MSYEENFEVPFEDREDEDGEEMGLALTSSGRREFMRWLVSSKGMGFDWDKILIYRHAEATEEEHAERWRWLRFLDAEALTSSFPLWIDEYAESDDPEVVADRESGVTSRDIFTAAILVMVQPICDYIAEVSGRSLTDLIESGDFTLIWMHAFPDDFPSDPTVAAGH